MKKNIFSLYFQIVIKLKTVINFEKPYAYRYLKLKFLWGEESFLKNSIKN